MSKNIFANSLIADLIFWGAIAEVEKVYFGNILVWEKASALPLPAPTIELTDNGLDIYDNSEGLAESFNIYVDNNLIVGDLTGTKWIFNKILILPKTTSDNDLIYNLTFKSNEEIYEDADGVICFMSKKNDRYSLMMYAGEERYYDGAWENENYRAITFIGGVDVTNQDLIKFIYQNAKRVDDIADLTNTTWQFGEDPFSLAYSDIEELFFTSNSENFECFSFTNGGNGMYMNFTDEYYIQVIEPGISQSTWTDPAYRIIHITGGTDATNSNLIDWLQINATLVL